jgi:hypothetical protein
MTSAVGERDLSGEKVIIEIADLVVEYCREPDGRTRAEDAISAAAAGAGEACIAAAGEFDPAVHDFTPGQAFVSDKVNRILVGDGDRWGNLPPTLLLEISKQPY